MKILIVEDDRHLSQLLEMTLRHYRINAICVGTMGEAEQAAKDQDFEMLVFDLSLPDSTPSETLARIKDLKKATPQGKILVMTGYDSIELRSLARLAGAEAFISKTDCPDIPVCVMKAAKIKQQKSLCFQEPLVDRIEREALTFLAAGV
jgi:DNA-binding response OmpR family regulator